MAIAAQSRVLERNDGDGAYGSSGRQFMLGVYGLVGMGIVFVFSSSFPRAGRPLPGSGAPYFFVTTQAWHALLGLGAMAIASVLRCAGSPMPPARHSCWG